MGRLIYSAFAYVGVLAVPAAYIAGWRYERGASLGSLGINLALFAAFIGIHFAMTTALFKRIVFGRPEGTLFERQVYIVISILTWVGMYVVHVPVGGPGFEAPTWLRFAGLCCVLLGIVAFFEFATIEGLGRLLGVHFQELSHASDAPLMTEGPYARVRHPMYRAASLYMLASLLIHPHSGQLLFVVLGMIGFLAFIPIEERQLLARRGDEYRRYMEATPYRVFRHIW